MADSIVRLRVDSQEYDNKLKRAAEGLNRYIEGCRKAGGTLEHVDDGVKEFTQQLGKMETVAGGAKGKLGEMTKVFTDLTMQFNAMTEAEKRGQFGKTLSSGLDELKQRIISTKQELVDINNSLNNVGGSGGGGLFGGDKLSGMLQVFGGNVMTKIAGAGLNFASELGDMVQQGIELARQGEGIRIAFERLGRGDILQGLREATHGTVTDLELMKAAVKFNDFKLPVEELGTMLAFAQQKAKDTGQSVEYMTESIVTGLGRKSLMILDNLGLSATEIRERMKETGDITKAVGAIIREQMSKAGDYVETAADRATQANVTLQNKMEELGRKFAPVEEASNQLWTSIKIGIMDIVGGPLAKLLNGLTEAGRLRNELNNVNGEGENNKVDNELKKLKAAKTAGASDYILKSMQSGVIEGFNREIINLDTQIKKLQRKAGEDMDGNMAVGIEARIKDLATRQNAYRTMIANYQSGASGIMNGGNSKNTPTTPTNTITPTGGTTTTTTRQTPQQRAQESFTKAEQNYKQALEQAAMELEAGTITRAQAAQKEAQAAEQRWKAIGDARNISDSPELKQAQDEAAAEYKRLAAEAKTATERQKALDKATRDLENANQKLATARSEMAQAKQQGDLQAYNTAKDKATAAQKEITRLEKVKVDVERGKVDLPDIPTEMTTTVDFQADTRNINAAISDVKKEMDTIPVGTIKFNLDQTKLVDLTTLKTLIDEQVKNGLEIDPEVTQGLFSKIQLGIDIEDTTWQELIDKINEKLKKLGLDTIKLDLTTGETSKKGREKKNPYIQTDEKGNEKSSLAGVMGGVATGMSEMASGMEALGIEIPKGFKDTISAVQGITSILNSIVVIVQAIEAISAIDSIIPFAHGGVVHAANGYVSGTTYSGDQIPAMLNAGEVVLNRGQQGVLAASLQAVGQSGEGGGGGKPYVSGEMIWLGLNNYLNRSGRGEIVTSKRR